MPWPLLSTNKYAIKNLGTSSDSLQTSVGIPIIEDEQNDWHELTISEQDSLLKSLQRVCVYWRQIFFDKIRFLLTLISVTMLNIATRLTCFTREPITTSVLSSIVSSPTIRTFEDNRNNSPTSFLNFDTQIDLPSTEDNSMARVLVQQQTPNINIHRTTATQDEALLPISHSVDERYFYKPDSNSLLQFFQRFASEPQISKLQSPTNGFLHNNNLSLSNAFLPLNNADEEEVEENLFTFDQIEPIVTEDIKSNDLDTISTAATTIDELDEDTLVNTTSSTTNDRPPRRRKRRSSLTRTPSIDGQSQSIVTDTIEKIDDNNNNNNNNTKVEEDQSTNVQPLSLENLSLEDNKQESNETNTTSNRIRGRRLRYRSYRAPQPQSQPTSSTSQGSASDDTIQFFLPTEPTTIATPPSSPTSPPADLPLRSTSPNSLPGKLKQTGSIGTTKKMVRFADSIGRQ